MIAIIDYGMGNIHSVQKALEFTGGETLVTHNPKDIENCQKIVLPGVGAFSDALSELERQDLISVLIEQIRKKKPFLGICLGMQLLFQESQEAKNAKGLCLLKGTVVRFEDKLGIKVPHMGWNQIKVKNGCPLLKDIPNDSYVYFCHSYYPQPQDKNVIASTCDYGIDFTAVVWQDNIYGAQFHPEKSQEIGLKILKNFIDLC